MSMNLHLRDSRTQERIELRQTTTDETYQILFRDFDPNAPVYELYSLKPRKSVAEVLEQYLRVCFSRIQNGGGLGLYDVEDEQHVLRTHERRILWFLLKYPKARFYMA